MSFLIIIVLWTWGLTPLWVNIVGTILMIGRFFANCMVSISKQYNDEKDDNKE